MTLVLEVLDKAPDGPFTKVSTGSILGSLRGTVAAKSWTDPKGLPMRPHLALDKDEPLAPNQPTQLDVPLWPTLWSIEPGHRLVVRIGTHVPFQDCLGLLSAPRGCMLTTPMTDSLSGGRYSLHRGGDLGSFISLPLLDHGAFPTIKTAEVPTRETPLPIAWREYAPRQPRASRDNAGVSDVAGWLRDQYAALEPLAPGRVLPEARRSKAR